MLPATCFFSVNSYCLPNICVSCKLYCLLHVLCFLYVPLFSIVSLTFLDILTTAWAMMKTQRCDISHFAWISWDSNPWTVPHAKLRLVKELKKNRIHASLYTPSPTVGLYRRVWFLLNSSDKLNINLAKSKKVYGFCSVFLWNKSQCVHLRTSQLWITIFERPICASLNRCKRMKAEPSRHIIFYYCYRPHMVSFLCRNFCMF